MVRIKLLLAALAFAATPASAQSLVTVCLGLSVVADPLSFSYTPSSAGQNSANIKLSCGIGLYVLPDVTVKLTAGKSNSFVTRRMDDAGGTNHLSYNIYTTSGQAKVWGDGNNGTGTQSVSGSLLGVGSFTFTAWGVIPAGQYVAATTYNDQMTVQVSF